MGLFSFLKNAGAKLFGKKDAPAVATAPTEEELKMITKQKEMRLKSIVESLGLEVENLDISLHDDTVTIYGQTESQANKEKIVLAVGNVEGIAAVDDRMQVVNPAPEAQFYQVQSGDSLSKIAKKYYGNAMKYPMIFEANKPMLSDPDKIYPGQMLRIPPMEDN